MKKTLIVLLTCVCLAVFAYSLMQVFSRDVAPPDYSEFRFERPVLTPESNAYTYVAAAVGVLDFQDDDFRLRLAFFQGQPVDETLIADLLARNQAMFDLIRKGVALGAYQPSAVQGMEDVREYPWTSLTTMGQLLATKIHVGRLAGHHAEAVADCVTLLRLGDLVQGEPNSVIGYLIGLAIMWMGNTQALALIQDQTLPVAELDRLIEALQLIESLGPGLAMALQSEVLLLSEYLGSIADTVREGSAWYRNHIIGLPKWMKNMPVGWDSAYFFQPHRTERRFLAVYRDLIHDAPMTYADMTWLKAAWNRPAEERAWLAALRPNAAGHAFLDSTARGMAGLTTRKCRTEANLRGTLLIAALRAYEHSNGALPGDLADLVPAYLAAVPTDPFDGQPFRYCPERRIVYAVGINLTDFGGTKIDYEGFEANPTHQEPGRLDDIVFDI